MRLISLKLENFRQHADTEIVFPAEGLTGILGANESGKSTVVEAIEWILFGARATRGTVKSIRWTGAVGRQIARGELVFEVGGAVYRCKRTENDATLKIEGRAAPIASSLTGVDSMVPQILGMDLDEFAATYLCRQKDLNRLASMGGTERNQFVLKTMGVGKVDRALKACRSVKNNLKNEVQGLKEGLGEREPLEEEKRVAAEAADQGVAAHHEAEQKVADTEIQHTSAKEALDASTEKQNQHRELEQKRTQASGEIDSAERELSRLRNEEEKATEARERVAKADEQLADLKILREERDSIREAKARANERIRLQRSIDEQTSEIAALKEKADELADSMPEEPLANLIGLSDAQQELAVLQEDRKNRLIEAEKARAVALSRSEEIGKQLQTISDVGSDGKCPTCTKVIGDDFDTICSALSEIVTQAEKDAAELQKKIDALKTPSDEEMELQARIDGLQERAAAAKQAREKREQITARLQELRADISRKERILSENRTELTGMPGGAYNQDRLTEVETRIQNLEKLEEQIRADRSLADRIPSIQEEKQRRTKQVELGHEVITGVSREIEALVFDAEKHREIFLAAEKAREDLTGAKAARARAEEAMKGARDRLERAEKALQGYDERAESLKAKLGSLKIHERTSERLADFRTAMAASIRPELEELTSGFVHILTDGRHEAVSLTEEFEVVMQESGLDMEVVSGGTEDISSIALRLAISQMIAERAGHPLSLLIFDEPFGSLDETRRRNVITLLERLKATFEQVLVVTHVDEVKDTVDQVLQVEFDEMSNRSRVQADWGMEVSDEPEEVPEETPEVAELVSELA